MPVCWMQSTRRHCHSASLIMYLSISFPLPLPPSLSGNMAAEADVLDRNWNLHSMHPLIPTISSADARMLGHTGFGVGVSVGSAEGRALGSRMGMGMNFQCGPTSLACSLLIPPASRLTQEAAKSMLSLPLGRVWSSAAEGERVGGAAGGSGVNGTGVGRPMGREYAYLGYFCFFVLWLL